MAVRLGDDLTDTKGEAPVLRELVSEDVQMEYDESVGKIDRLPLQTNVVVTKVKEPKDKVEAEGHGST
jgi:hypothetical protein